LVVSAILLVFVSGSAFAAGALDPPDFFDGFPALFDAALAGLAEAFLAVFDFEAAAPLAFLVVFLVLDFLPAALARDDAFLEDLAGVDDDAVEAFLGTSFPCRKR